MIKMLNVCIAGVLHKELVKGVLGCGIVRLFTQHPG